MDTSKEYVKMCEEAKEIQSAWKPKEWDYTFGDKACYGEKLWCILPDNIADGGVYGLSPENFEEEKDRTLLWLPRQDQLQKMVGEGYPLILRFEHFSDWAKTDLTLKESICGGTQFAKFNSMEQLWLAFVMKEKFKKQWNGKDWIKKEVCYDQERTDSVDE